MDAARSGELRRDASHPSDVNLAEIGDEVAAARPLRRIGEPLLGVASDDIEAIEGYEVHPRRCQLLGTNGL